jgi:hypothetical protein
MAGRPFVRVYYIDLQRDYPDVWHDHGALAALVRLLALADQSWPIVPELPSSVRKADLKRLVDASLVVLEAHGRYRVKGYEVERTARQDHAASAALSRYVSSAPSSAPSSNRADPVPTSYNRTNGVREEPRARSRPSTVDRDPLLRQIREVYQAKDKER